MGPCIVVSEGSVIYAGAYVTEKIAGHLDIILRYWVVDLDQACLSYSKESPCTPPQPTQGIHNGTFQLQLMYCRLQGPSQKQ